MINYFAELEKEKNKNPSIDKLKVLKLVWISDILHLRRYWKLIIWDTYFDMKMWPVACWIKNICEFDSEYLSSKTLDYISEYLQKSFNEIRTKKETDFSQFSDSNFEVINEVFDKFWLNNSFRLKRITCNYLELTKPENKLNKSTKSEIQINYFDFFENTLNQDKIFNLSEEHLEISKEIFEENLEFDRMFCVN